MNDGNNISEVDAKDLLEKIAYDLSDRYHPIKFFIEKNKYNERYICFYWQQELCDFAYVAWSSFNNSYVELLNSMINNQPSITVCGNDGLIDINMKSLYGRSICEMRVNIDLFSLI